MGSTGKSWMEMANVGSSISPGFLRRLPAKAVVLM